ncbi:MAG: serine hydrolase domain-containing protein [Microthrixaceae bacterium]
MSAAETDAAGTAPIDPAALDDLRARIRREVDEGLTPAAQFAVARGGEVLVAESFGSATDSTRFNVFSCTKALICGVVWQLIGEGHLASGTRVGELVPRFGAEGRDAGAMAAITLEQVLTHTGGFPSAPLGPPRWATREGRLDAMSRWRLSWEPGTRFEYHATSAHWVAAEMIEVVEGADYRDVVRRRLLEPLGLEDLVLGVPADEQGDVAELVPVGEPPSAAALVEMFGTADLPLGEVTPDVLLAFNDPEVRAVGVPGGGALSTAADLARYYQALLANPGGLWDPAVLADGTGHVRNRLPNPMTGEPASRTLGLVVAGDDGKGFLRGMGHRTSPRAFGHNGAAGQIAWADPATGVSFVYLTAGVDRDFLREGRRIVGISSRGGALVPAPGD